MAPGERSSQRTIESRPGAHDNVKLATLNDAKLAIREQLECPICIDFMYPPISQCPNGHTLCSNCRSKVKSCPICRGSLGNIRCLALERVAESLELLCKCHNSGCQDLLSSESKLKHEQNCRFRPYNCPCAGDKCSVTGDIPFLVVHLNSHHKVDILHGPTLQLRFTNPQRFENATWLNVIKCYNYQFCLHFEAFNLGTTPAFVAFILFMGEDSDARKFSYSLEVGGNGRKMAWEGVPRSIRDSHLKVRNNNDGLIIQRNIAQYFSKGDRKELSLDVAGRIWKK